MNPNPQTYFNERLSLYGITPALNCIQLLQHDAETNTEKLTSFPIFKEHEKGIEITPYTLDRLLIKYSNEGSRWKNKTYSIIRLNPEIVKPDGTIQKYQMPKGQGTPPLIPPTIIEAYEKKTEIETLYLTEGYFKAFKACMVGINCIGLISITCMIDKTNGKLHADILKIITVCKVKRVVWLTDADCRSITKDEITPEKDLYKRVHGFYKSIHNFQELLSSLDDIKLYFAHICENLESKSKGLDDLLINEADSIEAIVKESNQFDKIKNGKFEGNYFVKFNINYGLATVRNYFLLNDVTQFYLHHSEIRKDLKDKKFRFNGTLYSYNNEEGKCVIEIPKNAADYFRVGDTYYENIKIPNRYGELTTTYHARQKSTINEDNGKTIFQHIAKYKAFCNTPDHINYQRVIHGCFNTYHPFQHIAEDGECAQTLEFLKHIFGTDEIEIEPNQTVQRWELGIDYLNLLYKHPQHILPILCLVSKQRQTGKTTFAKWLKLLFTENMAIVGNADFENSFNAHWISKLMVCVDETKIDKMHVVEKIKSLSTANYTMMNAKGKDQVEIETFLKFLLLSNNEDNFINIDKEEIRFWVIQVPEIPNRVKDLEQFLLDEIPAFLHYLNTRTMVTTSKERHWFKTDWLRTAALTKIQENSAPTLWKLLKARITNIFEDHDINTLTMPANDIREQLLKGKNYEDGYIKQILNQNGYTLGPTIRGSFPRMIEVHNQTPGENGFEKKGIAIKFHGRAYTFHRKDFTETTVSSSQMEIDLNTPENKIIDDMPF